MTRAHGSFALPQAALRLAVPRLSARLRAGTLRLHLGGTTHELVGAVPGPSADIILHRPLHLAHAVLTRGHVGLGEAYVAGDWDSPDLTTALQFLARNAPSADLPAGLWPQRLATWFYHQQRANTRVGSQRNIAAHYDLGNDFYRLWLDDSMTYSCALFAHDDEPLEQAQERKYRALLELLAAAPGSHLLDIGCGWGGLAQRAARAGHRVTGITLSRAQLAWAHAALAGRPEAARIELRFQDYRDVSGTFDHIVSIEMFEAVGERYWCDYFQALQRLLRPGGRAALQVIVIDEAHFADYRAHPDFIQRYIFPGGMLPTVARFIDAARAAGLALPQPPRFYGLDYARTLACWQRRFLACEAAVAALGYDSQFRRQWHYYLAYCEAGFRERRIDLMQIVLQRP